MLVGIEYKLTSIVCLFCKMATEVEIREYPTLDDYYETRHRGRAIERGKVHTRTTLYSIAYYESELSNLPCFLFVGAATPSGASARTVAA